jgi:hypothetical protein
MSFKEYKTLENRAIQAKNNAYASRTYQNNDSSNSNEHSFDNH